MAYRAVLFDLDGTLLNTIDDIADSANLALTENGLSPYPVERYHYFVGNGVAILIQRLTADTPEKYDGVREKYIQHYEREGMCERKTQPYPGIMDMLREMNRRGIPVCVLSNKPHQSARDVIARYFPEITFAEVFGQREGVPVKPDPAAAKEIASLLGIRPEEFLYVGDTSVDMETGRGAGMYPVGVLWGFRTREELEESGAREIIGDPMELCRLLDENK